MIRIPGWRCVLLRHSLAVHRIREPAKHGPHGTPTAPSPLAVQDPIAPATSVLHGLRRGHCKVVGSTNLDSRLRFGHTSPEKGHTVVFYFLLLLLLLLLWVGQSPRPYSRKRNLDLQPSGEGCRIQPASCVRVGPIPRRGCHELVVAPGLPALCGRDVRYRSEMNQNKRQEVAMTNSHRHGCGAGA